MLKKAKFLH